MEPTRDIRRDFACEVVRRLQHAGYIALWVGGCVRDIVMGRPPQDYDVATTATPEQVRTLFGRKSTLAVGESFGVVIVLGSANLPTGHRPQVEVATFRSEGPYADGRRPDHVQFCSPEADAQRRDFTINGMFFDPLTEQLTDYVGGKRDLEQRVLRAIGDPYHRMTEDKLRMLRAVRFAATFDFQMAPETYAAVKELSRLILVVSPERIAQELKRMLAHSNRRRAMELAADTGQLEIIFPEIFAEESQQRLTWLQTLTALDSLQQPRFEIAAAVLWYAVPSPPDGRLKDLPEFGTVRSLCRRLRLSNYEIDLICWLTQSHPALDDPQAVSQAQRYRLLAQPEIRDLISVQRAIRQVTQEPITGIEEAERLLRTLPPQTIDPPALISGRTLIDRGLAPGPIFRELLDSVRDAQLNGVISTEGEALAWLDKISITRSDS